MSGILQNKRQKRRWLEKNMSEVIKDAGWKGVKSSELTNFLWGLSGELADRIDLMNVFTE